MTGAPDPAPDQGHLMRSLLTITVTLVAITAAAPVQAQYYGSYINQPRGYAPPVYAPPPVYAAPPVYRPRVVVTPGYYNNGAAYTDYRHFGDPTTRDSLATCAYC
jgi:hypothetical protein